MATAADFRRIALSFPDVSEHEHGGQPAFTVGSRRFAGLASVAQGYGNLILTPEIQAGFVADAPGIFLPIPGGFGRMGHTHIILAAADSTTLHDALHTAYKLRVQKNSATKSRSRRPR
ncbi:MAG TPA: MmcQ/YjbR family DNA-binding protein [Acidobacteriaceae bacterium]|nr:MmcQ/YjbR family DNA-binding protein [Acidobacteriaceae bacterium]